MDSLKQMRLHLLPRISDYAIITIKLYGAIKIEDFVDVFNHYEEENINNDEARYFLELIVNIVNLEMNLIDDILTSNYYFNKGLNRISHLLSKQTNKVRYLPNKNLFDLYPGEEFIDPIEPFFNIKEYIIDEEVLEYKYIIIHKINSSIARGEFDKLMEDVRSGKLIDFNNKDSKTKFIKLLKELKKDIRTHENCGHTDNELASLAIKEHHKVH